MHNSAMKPRETDYAAPEMELLELLVEQVIARSGDIDDYDTEDFDWE